MTTPTEAWAYSPLLPDLHCQRYILHTNKLGNIAICWGAEPGACCPGPISGNIAFYLKLQILWLSVT